MLGLLRTGRWRGIATYFRISALQNKPLATSHEGSDSTHTSKIFAIWAREHAPGGFGRDKIVASLKAALRRQLYEEIFVQNVLEKQGLFGLGPVAVRYLFQKGPKALQLLIYEDGAEIRRVVDRAVASQPDVIIVDTVRLIKVAESIRRRLPTARIVIDMDDLMSRRYENLAKKAAPLNVGFLSRFVPERFVKVIGINAFAGAIYRGEARGLRNAELRAHSVADDIVLVSPAEAKMFEASHPGGARVRAILPPTLPQERSLSIKPPFHFIFVGSDRLPQNAMTIDYLLDLWARRKPPHHLKIFGRMARKKSPPDGVTFMGFAPDIAKIYDPGAILLSPAFLAGGIKTKILESFSFGAPVIGTSLSFEGLDAKYPLAFETVEEMEVFIMNIGAHQTVLHSAQQIGNAFVRRHCAPAVFETCWDRIVGMRP